MKNRIVIKRTNKRDAGGFLLFVFLLPYVCACLWGHTGAQADLSGGGQEQPRQTADTGITVRAGMPWGTWEMPLGEYLCYRLQTVIPADYEPEALKAQAVLLRTEAVKTWQEQGQGVLSVDGAELEEWYRAGEQERESLAGYFQAVEETAGVYLCYGGEPIRACYFRVSNGSTRDAGRLSRTDGCPYLTAVDCAQDRTSPEYGSEATVLRSVFRQEILARIGAEYGPAALYENMELLYDESGYVSDVVFHRDGGADARMDGEAFRYLFGLPSASFTTEQTDTAVVFHVTGVGHGFGMSQYGADCMALNGSDYAEILDRFFPQTELAKIE